MIMSAHKPQQKYQNGWSDIINISKIGIIVMKYFRILLILLFLTLLLWSTLLRPSIDVDIRWVPKSFFSSAKLITCIIRMQNRPLSLLEATFFAVLALCGYLFGVGSVSATDRSVYGTTLASFEKAMMGAHQKFYWLCFVPWIVTFAQNWFQNVAEFLLMFSGNTIYEAHNVYSAMLLLIAYFLVQALLASEVIYMALHGWCAMKNINNENVEWERRKRMFSVDTLDTVFGKEN